MIHRAVLALALTVLPAAALAQDQLGEIAGYPVLGQIDDLWLCVRDYPIDEVLIALSVSAAADPNARAALSCRNRPVGSARPDGGPGGGPTGPT